jgi:hypothetical protein
MAVNKDYIPYKDTDFKNWGTAFVKGVAAGAEEWGIPAEEVAELQALVEQFSALLFQALSPRKTPVIVFKKNQIRKQLVTAIRTMTGFRLKNPAIADYQRVTLGLHVRDKAYTRIQAPDTCPQINTWLRLTYQVIVVIHNADGGRAKPYGTVGAYIAYEVSDTPIKSYKSLTRNVLATRTPCTLDFEDADRGKNVYIAACWQTKKGKRGPWSQIINTIVP